MSNSFIAAANARSLAAAAVSDSVGYFLVGPEATKIILDDENVTPPAESFIGTLLRNADGFASESLKRLPACDANFFRLLLQFWSVPQPALPLTSRRYRIRFNSLVDDLSCRNGASEPDGLILALLDAPSHIHDWLRWWPDIDPDRVYLLAPSADAPDDCRGVRIAEDSDEEAGQEDAANARRQQGLYEDSSFVTGDGGLLAWVSEHAPRARYERVEHKGAAFIAIERDALRAALIAREVESGRMSVRRVQLMFRGGLYHVAQPPAVGGGLFEVEVAEAAVLNEVRVTAIDVLTHHNGEWRRLTPANNSLHRAVGVAPRLVPGFTVYGADAYAPAGWRTLSSRAHVAGEALEVRQFVRSNTRSRREGGASLLGRFLDGAQLAPEVLWREVDFHGDDDLTFWLARRVVETTSKLKT